MVFEQHLHQGLPYLAIAGDEQIDRFERRAVEELAVDGPDGLVGLVGSDDDRDVPLGRALCRGADGNAAAAQCCEHPPRRTAVAQDVVAHQADDRITGLYLERLEFAQRDLVGEASVGRPLGSRRVGLRDGDAHRMDRRGLRDEDDVDACAGQRVEQTRGETGDTDHTAAFQRDKGNLVGIGYAQQRLLPSRRILLYERSGVIRIEGVLNIDRDALVDDRLDGRREDDLRAEMRQLLRRAIGDIANGTGRRHRLGIGRHDTRHVGPYFYQSRMHADGKERGCVVGASASERRDSPLLVGSDKTRNDEKRGMRLAFHRRGHIGISPDGIHYPADGRNQLPGIEPVARNAERSELGGKDLRRKQFAVALYRIQARGAEFSQQEDPVKDAPERIEETVDGLPDSGFPVGGQQLLDHFQMPSVKAVEFGQIAFIALGGQVAEADQRVGAAADSRTDQDRTVAFDRSADDLDDSLGRGDGRAAEFQNLHNRSSNCPVSNRKPSWPKDEVKRLYTAP